MKITKKTLKRLIREELESEFAAGQGLPEPDKWDNATPSELMATISMGATNPYPEWERITTWPKRLERGFESTPGLREKMVEAAREIGKLREEKYSIHDQMRDRGNEFYEELRKADTSIR